MQWNSFSEFINMGGYGFYVWTSYGVTLVMLAGELVALRERKRRAARTSEVRRKLES